MSLGVAVILFALPRLIPWAALSCSDAVKIVKTKESDMRVHGLILVSAVAVAVAFATAGAGCGGEPRKRMWERLREPIVSAE